MSFLSKIVGLSHENGMLEKIYAKFGSAENTPASPLQNGNPDSENESASAVD